MESLAADPAEALAALGAAAASGGAPDRAARRIASARALLGADMAWVDDELERAVAAGVEPATSSARHLLEAGGKRVRPLATLLSAACFAGAAPPRAARELAVVAELVHLSTLLHDDVIDEGDERRGRPAARRVWGNAVSVLAGDLLLTHALERASRAGDGDALQDLLATLRRLVDGEVVQLRGRACIDLDEATYFRVVHDKTAALFAWACRAGARAARAPGEGVEALGAFGRHLGIAFQLVDDVLDYAGDPAVTGKALHADLREGKLTLPLLRAVAARPELAGLVDAARAGDAGAARAVAEGVIATGACASVRALARVETERARAALEAAPAGPARGVLAAVAGELAARAA